MDAVHPLLHRQLIRFFGGLENVPTELESFLVAVNAAYHQVDEERQMSRHSLELQAQDLGDSFTAMRAAYQRLVHSSPDGIFTFNRELICTVWNPGMTELTGVAEGDALRKPIMDALQAIAFDDAASIIQVLLDSMLLIEDHAYRRACGATGYLAGHLAPLRNEGGEILGGLGVLRDITDSKRIADALQQRLRETLLLNRVIAAASSSLDLDTVLQTICRELALAFDLPQAGIALLNRERTELTIVGDYHPEGIPAVLGATIPVANNPTTLYVLEQRTPLAIPDVRADERLGIVRALVSERRIASMLLVPLVTRDQVLGTLGLDSYTRREFTADEIALVQNVAAAASQAVENAQLYNDLEKERANLLLANDAGRVLASQMSMRQVLEAALALAPRLGAEHAYVLVVENGEPLFFKSTFPPTQRWGMRDSLAFARRLLNVGLEKNVLASKQPVIVADTRGDPHWYHAPVLETAEVARSVVAVPYFGTRSTLAGVIAYHHSEPQRFDERSARVVELIGRYLATALENARLFEQTQAALQDRQQAENERLALERKMLEAQKLESLGVLAGGIAHDFNNLLVTMLGNAGLALMELPPDARARQYIEQMQVAAQRAADLTRQMLAYSGKGRFIVQPVSLDDVIEEMAKLLRVSISKQASLQLNLAPNLPLISADITQLRQVVMNLITNASDALEDKRGTITVSTGTMFADRIELARMQAPDDLPEGEYVFLEVADTGVGMDADTQARIFEPFFTTKFAGRGLGLAAVLGITRGHRGAIQVFSAPGEGTTIRLLFPPLPDAAETLPPTPRWSAQHRATVLVVDDETTVREITVDMLQKFGYETLAAESGARAVQVAREQLPDCVLLDLTMPGLSGEETVRCLRELNPNLRVLLMSGYSEQDATSRFSDLPLDGFVQKPFTPFELNDRVQAVLSSLPTLLGYRN